LIGKLPFNLIHGRVAGNWHIADRDWLVREWPLRPDCIEKLFEGDFLQNFGGLQTIN